mmetsp:Transcript_83679/g.249746  ORF Transcript_83679/g.249746 Transcript_83679/m.249746 type:complete len:459 (+) Transcript_83679:604-1980(+)
MTAPVEEPDAREDWALGLHHGVRAARAAGRWRWSRRPGSGPQTLAEVEAQLRLQGLESVEPLAERGAKEVHDVPSSVLRDDQMLGGLLSGPRLAVDLTLLVQEHALHVPVLWVAAGRVEARTVLFDPEPVAQELVREELRVLLVPAPVGPEVRPLAVQDAVPGLRSRLPRKVDDLDLLRLPCQQHPLSPVGPVGVKSEEHLVELEVVLHADVRPGCVRPVAAQEVLLRAVALAVLRVAGLLDLRKHLLPSRGIGVPEHDPSVDAGALAPGPLRPVAAEEEVATVELVPRAVREAVVHAPTHGGWRRQVEELVDIRPHEEVDIHHQDLLELGELHATELREDLLKAVLLLREAQGPHAGVHVLDRPAVPEPGQDLHVACRHIVRVETDTRVPRTGPLQGVAQDHGPDEVVCGRTPEADQEGVLPSDLLRRSDRPPGLREVGVHGPLAVWAEAPPAVRPP